MSFEFMTFAELEAKYPPRDYPPEPEVVPTFEELAQLEPRLQELLTEAQATRRKRGYLAGKVWYGYGGYPGLKPRLLELVGWEREEEHTLLSTRTAYDVAYDTIYEALPDDN